MDWRKSTFCGTDHVTEQCIEVAEVPDSGGGLVMRSAAGGPYLHVTRDELRAFLAGAKAGEFDDLA